LDGKQLSIILFKFSEAMPKTMKSILQIARTALIALTLVWAPPSEAALAGDCKWRNSQWGSYCVITRAEGGSRIIEVILKSKREGTKVMTYRGNSFSPGAVLIDDEYNGQHILRYFGADRIILQDKNGNPPDVYLR
jgi:hypothetical protein